MNYLFLRHAETDVSDRFEWHGKADPPLSAKGRKHALAAAERLWDLGHKVSVIVASDHCRAVETAEVFSKVFGCAVVQDPMLRERDLGEWTGLSQREIEQRWPGHMDAWRAGDICGPPGGETDDEVSIRLTRALRSYFNSRAELKLIIAHAGLLRGLLASQGMPDEDVQPLSGRWLTLLPPGQQVVIGEGTSL